MMFWKLKQTPHGNFVTRCRWRPIVVGFQLLMVPVMIAITVIVLCLSGCVCTPDIRGGDMTPQNDCPMIQAGFAALDQLPKMLR